MSRVTGSLLGGSFEDQLILCALISFLFQYSFAFGSLCCCVGFSPVVARGGNSLTVVHRLLIAASLAVEHGLEGTWGSVAGVLGLSSCSFQALEHRLNSCGTWA